MDIRNYCTKVKKMKIRFLTLVEKKVPTSLQTLLPYLRRFSLWDSFSKSLKNNNGVRISECKFSLINVLSIELGIVSSEHRLIILKFGCIGNIRRLFFYYKSLICFSGL